MCFLGYWVVRSARRESINPSTRLYLLVCLYVTLCKVRRNCIEENASAVFDDFCCAFCVLKNFASPLIQFAVKSSPSIFPIFFFVCLRLFWILSFGGIFLHFTVFCLRLFWLIFIWRNFSTFGIFAQIWKILQTYFEIGLQSMTSGL